MAERQVQGSGILTNGHLMSIDHRNHELSEFSLTELKQLTANQCSMFSLLAHLFRMEVSDELLHEMKTLDTSQLSGYPDIDEGYRILGGFIAQSSARTATDLAVEYARIFLGAGLEPGAGAYPYESVYTSDRKLLMQDARDKVVDRYRQAGVSVAGDVTEPEDHLGFELEFVVYLAEQTVRALDNNDTQLARDFLNRQQRFLGDHLVPWVPKLLDDVERLAKEQFYVAVACITRGFLTLMQDLTDELAISVENECAALQ